ncbi:MAG: hypothetical protein R3B07_12845 [Polyangiaceae bacterium]
MAEPELEPAVDDPAASEVEGSSALPQNAEEPVEPTSPDEEGPLGAPGNDEQD